MAADDKDEQFAALLERLHGGHGDWGALNTLVFLFTSFTTVGYGNHPSLVRTDPPCQYPSEFTITDDPYSVLLPESLRPETNELVKSMEVLVSEEESDGDPIVPAFTVPPEACFEPQALSSDSNCWVVSDEQSIFDFGKLVYFQTHESEVAANYSAPARATELSDLTLPGLRKTLKRICSDLPDISGGTNSTLDMEWRKTCFTTFRSECDFQLEVWRKEESKKDVAKVYTSLFILIGIGLLGQAVGALGDEVMAWVKRLFSNVEMALDAVTLDQMGTATGDKKGIVVAMSALLSILVLGTIVYAQLEKMKLLDAMYFTVVTATTVGFGDYVPETNPAKVSLRPFHLDLCHMLSVRLVHQVVLLLQKFVWIDLTYSLSVLPVPVTRLCPDRCSRCSTSLSRSPWLRQPSNTSGMYHCSSASAPWRTSCLRSSAAT